MGLFVNLGREIDGWDMAHQEDPQKNDPEAAEAAAAAFDLDPEIVDSLVDCLGDDNLRGVEDLIAEVHAADLADLVEQLSPRLRKKFIEAFSDRLDPEMLSELDEAVRDEVIEQLEPEQIAAAISELDADDAVYLLEDLDEEERNQVLQEVPEQERAEVEAGLSYPEDSAGRLMQQDFIAVPTYWTVGQTIDFMRDDDGLPDDFYEILVVDPRMRPVGSIALNRVLRAKRPVTIESIMEPDPILINADSDQEDVAYLFQQYDFVSAPVVDRENRLLGTIMVDDIVDVISEEAEEDIMLLSGMRESAIHESTLQTTRIRFAWLLANLFTAIIASLVIAQFDGSIEQMVALAVLMPIVASMGGNAGTQTLTVAVRALGTRELTTSNALRTVNKELLVGAINGALFAVIMGVIAAVWFGDWLLGGVIGAAMTINLVVASLAGILVPLGLARSGIDPALASSVFVTTITDVVGFLAFLGLAALVLL